MPATPRATGTPLVVDAHVHLHPAFDLETFLSAAATNVARAVPAQPDVTGVLLLAESPGEGALARLRTAREGAHRWSIQVTREPGSLIIRRPGHPVLIAVAGRQLTTAEGVEVLALLHTEAFPDGQRLQDTVAAIQRAGALPVLPWGFGKWLGRRGTLVRALLRAHDGPLFLGDNGGRPAVLPTPALLVEGARLVVPVLPGSDPLPLRDHETRAGSFGFYAEVPIDLDRPAAGLRAWLLSRSAQPTGCGRRVSLGRFAWNQVRMQWRKRITGRA